MLSSVSPLHHWTRIPMAMVLALAVLFAPGVVSTAHAATGSLTVQTFSDETGTQIGHVDLAFYVEDPSGIVPPPTPISTGTTDATGAAEVVLEEGDYWVTSSRVGYLPTTYVTAVSGGQSDQISIYLSQNPDSSGVLSGTVLDEGGAIMAPGRGHIMIYQADVMIHVQTVHTVTHGRFTASLPPGSYKIQISDEYGDLNSTWVGGSSFATAQTFSLAAHGSVTVPPIQLALAPAVAGTARDTSGRPIAGIDVTLYASDDETQLSSTTTDRRGAYHLNSVNSGTYKLRFDDPKAEYVGEWYDDQDNFAGAHVITVATSDLQVNAVLRDAPALDTPYRLRGAVASKVNGPVARRAWVDAYRRVTNGTEVSYEWESGSRTDKNGTYTFRDLPPGVYKVQVGSFDHEFPAVWSGDKYDRSAATTVAVPETGQATAPPITVIEFGQVTGKVTLPAVAVSSYADISVSVYNLDGEPVGNIDVDNDGAFTVKELIPGTYKVRASGTRHGDDGEGSESHFGFVPKWWKNSSSLDSATAVSVTEDGTTAGINFTLSRTISNVARPTVTGSTSLGSRLTANPGTWTRMSDTRHLYQWLRGGKPVAGATTSTYLTSSADLGQSISVRVTVSDIFGAFAAGTANSTTKVIKGKSVVRMKVSSAKRSATVRVSLAMQGVARAKTSGVVRVYDGTKLKKSIAIRRGVGSVKVNGLKKGTHTITVKFAGSGSHTAASGSKRVRVK